MSIVQKKRVNRFGPDGNLEFVPVFLLGLLIFFFIEKLLLLQRRLSGVGDNIRFKIKNLFQVFDGKVQDQVLCGSAGF